MLRNSSLGEGAKCLLEFVADLVAEISASCLDDTDDLTHALSENYLAKTVSAVIRHLAMEIEFYFITNVTTGHRMDMRLTHLRLYLLNVAMPIRFDSKLNLASLW